MNKTMQEIQQEQEERRKQAAIEALLGEIMSNYHPHAGDGDADYMPTSVEFANRISETITIGPDTLAIYLTMHGYHTKLVGTRFCWLLDLK